VNVKVFAADLAASYHVNRYVSVFASYALLLQRSSGSVGAVAGNIDQNRVFVGLQIRYPIDLN
jgi:predicted porin